MDLKRIIGQCAPLFFMAVTFDLVGFILMLVGLAASPRIGERVYGDFLALTGAVLMFFGLGMWVMWYAGNIAADGKRTRFGRIARKLTERMSSMRMTGKSGKAWDEEREVEEEEVEVEEEEVKERQVEEEEEEMKERKVEDEEVKEVKVEEEEVKVEEEEVNVEDEEDKGVKVEKEEVEEQDEGKREEDAGYINEAYEPTESETV